MDSQAEFFTFLALTGAGFAELWIPEVMEHACWISMFLSWEFSSTVGRVWRQAENAVYYTL